jgi:hypothetical protein
MQTNDLPPEVLEQLRYSHDDTATQIAELLEDSPSAMTLNDIIVAYYRHTKRVLLRKVAQAKLAKLAKVGRIERVAGRRGLYVAPCTDGEINQDQRQELIESA